MDRDCLNCGESISPSKRKDSVYCSKSCGRSHYYRRHKPRLRAQQNEWRENNRETYRAGAKKYYKKNRESILARERKRNYGISEEEYNALLEKQRGRCAICLGDSTRNTRTWSFHVDHDHATGQVRGLLCSSCNLGLGHFGDDPIRLQAAAKYLWGNWSPEIEARAPEYLWAISG